MDCSNTTLGWFFVVVKNFMIILNIVAPLLLMISLLIRFINKMKNPDDKKESAKIKNSIIALFILFFIPLFINIVLSWIDDSYNISECINNAKENGNSSYIENSTNKQNTISNNSWYEKSK